MISAIVQRLSWHARTDQYMRDVIQGSSKAFVLRVLGAGLSFGFNAMLARLLGAQGVGIYYLAFTPSLSFTKIKLGPQLL